MRSIEEAGYVLTRDEMFVLAGLTGADSFIGIDLSFSCVGERSIRSMLETVKNRLIQKRYIQEQSGELHMDGTLFSLIRMCCNPSALLRIIECKSGIKHCVCYYFQKDIVVELDEDLILKNTFKLTPLYSIKKVMLNMEAFLHVYNEHDNDNFSFSLSVGSMRTLKENDRSMREITDMMMQKGVNSEYVEDLVKALSEENEIHSILVMSPEGKLYKNNTIYAGRRFLWKVEHKDMDSNAATISIYNSKCHHATICQTIEAVRNSFGIGS